MEMILKHLVQIAIRIYQMVLSPFLGSRCRFFPPCSEYAHEAVGRFGPLRGILKTLNRLTHCHPFHPGGYDPVSK